MGKTVNDIVDPGGIFNDPYDIIDPLELSGPDESDRPGKISPPAAPEGPTGPAANPFRRPRALTITEQLARLDRRRSIASAIRRRRVTIASSLGPSPAGDSLGAA